MSALLRRERETLLENYRALEDAFQARNWEPVTEVFAHDPYVDPKDEGIGHLIANAFVEQLLPVSSHGVAGIALHFNSVPRDGGELVVVLSYVESGEGVAEWSVPFSQLVPTWNFFALPRTCDLAGTIVDPAGAALASQFVYLSVIHDDGSKQSLAGRTDDEGRLDDKGRVRASAFTLEVRVADSKGRWKSQRLDGSAGDAIDLGKIVLEDKDD